MNSKDIQRYIALDIHKEYVMAGAMNAAQEWVIHPRKVEMLRFRMPRCSFGVHFRFPGKERQDRWECRWGEQPPHRS